MDSDQQQPPEMPADTGAPPAQQPYAPPQQPQQPYQPAGGYPPPPPAPQRKGFNWVACCGITCVVLLIIGGLAGYCGYRFLQPVIGVGIKVANVEEQVNSTDLAAIKAEAMQTDASVLAANAPAYEGQWLALEGVIAEDAGAGSPAGPGGFGTQDATYYILQGPVVVMDLSQAAAVGGIGDRIRAYGQCVAWDLLELEKMPIIGKGLTEGMTSDPELEGRTQIVIFVAKEVALVTLEDDPPAEPAGIADEADTGNGSGWLK